MDTHTKKRKTLPVRVHHILKWLNKPFHDWRVFMIRMFQIKNSARAKSYFRDALSKADYYINDHELKGAYSGHVAKRLGLDGQMVDKQSFEKLCDNINPQTGKPLTPRTLKDRRVAYDISFHCPKSVSIAYCLTMDSKIFEVMDEAVQETMMDMQADMQTRIRTKGQNGDRHTGEMIWCNFPHLTARAVDGHAPDPHFHHHVITFNTTFDKEEGRYKAGQFHNIKRDMPYYQARFHKRLADKLSILGYDTRQTRKSFELTAVPQRAIDLFSKRTNHIGQVAREKGIVDAHQLDKLGALTRNKKQSSLSMSQLQDVWQNELKEAGIGQHAKNEVPTRDYSLTAQKVIDHTVDHSFERASVKSERRILAQGYHYAVDNADISIGDIDEALREDKKILRHVSKGQTFCTTQEVLHEEKTMLTLAQQGIGQFKPFVFQTNDNTIVKELGEEQKLALHHILSSKDGLTMVKGGAGTGKTTLINYAIEEFEKEGFDVFLFAPTSNAAHDVLKSEGFEKTDTLSRLLHDEALQHQTKGQVIWADEAGMIGTKDMVKLLKIAETNNARIILSGDYRQHSSVDRGDAMRLLETKGNIPIVSLNTIYRQRKEIYKSAVLEISKGNMDIGFQKLDEMQAIKEVDYTDIHTILVDDYLKIRKDKKSGLVISPTREQTQKINENIRAGLRSLGIVKKRQKTVTVLENQFLTNAQKMDARVYKEGNIIQVHQNIKGIQRGEKLNVVRIEGNKIIAKDKKGKEKPLPLENPDRFDVYRKREISLSKGDEVRITKNSFDKNGQRINNGSVVSILNINEKQGIRVVKKSQYKETELILPLDFGNLDYAYCSTSHASQGKTVDYVLINQPSVTFPASNQKQFYVSVSRAREGVSIYTDDKESLLGQIQKSGDRFGATELVNYIDFENKRIIYNEEKELKKQKLNKSNKIWYDLNYNFKS